MDSPIKTPPKAQAKVEPETFQYDHIDEDVLRELTPFLTPKEIDELKAVNNRELETLIDSFIENKQYWKSQIENYLGLQFPSIYHLDSWADLATKLKKGTFENEIIAMAQTPLPIFTYWYERSFVQNASSREMSLLLFQMAIHNNDSEVPLLVLHNIDLAPEEKKKLLHDVLRYSSSLDLLRNFQSDYGKLTDKEKTALLQDALQNVNLNEAMAKYVEGIFPTIPFATLIRSAIEFDNDIFFFYLYRTNRKVVEKLWKKYLENGKIVEVNPKILLKLAEGKNDALFETLLEERPRVTLRNLLRNPGLTKDILHRKIIPFVLENEGLFSQEDITEILLSSFFDINKLRNKKLFKLVDSDIVSHMLRSEKAYFDDAEDLIEIVRLWDKEKQRKFVRQNREYLTDLTKESKVSAIDKRFLRSLPE